MSNVPKLRFSEFGGDWEENKLSEVSNIIGGGTPETAIEEYWNGDIQWFTPTEIKSDYVSNSLRTISELGLKKSSAKILPIGTILLTTRATIGEVSIALRECTTNQGFQSLIVKDDYINIFIFNWIKNNKYKFTSKANGSTFPEISKSEIEKIKIKIPSKPEQEKIASFLNSIDARIEQLTKKEELLEKYKNTLVEQIFSKKIRFKKSNGTSYEDWKTVRIDELYDLSMGKTILKKDLIKIGIPVYSATEEDKIFGFIKNSNKILKEGSLVISARGTIGSIKFIKEDSTATQTTICCSLKNKKNKLFSFIYCELMKFKRNKIFISSKGGIPQLTIAQVEKINELLPSNEEEQTKIANFLSSIDKKIDLTKKELNSTKEFKKALLQQMFI